jgi:hypothetical protein
VYISDVPADDWPAGVDVQEPRITRKAARKHPTPEGPSQKRKSTDPLGTGALSSLMMKKAAGNDIESWPA